MNVASPEMRTPKRVRDLLQKSMDSGEYTLRGLSAQIGISRYLLGRYLEGTSEPRPANLKKIADFFGVSIGYLVASRGRAKISSERAKAMELVSHLPLSKLAEAIAFLEKLL